MVCRLVSFPTLGLERPDEYAVGVLGADAALADHVTFRHRGIQGKEGPAAVRRSLHADLSDHDGMHHRVGPAFPDLRFHIPSPLRANDAANERVLR